MSEKLDSIVQALGKLSQQELLLVQAHVKAMLNLAGTSQIPEMGTMVPKTGAEKNADASLILHVIVDVYRGLGLEHASVADLEKSAQYPAFVRKVPAVMEYARKVSRIKNEQRAFLKLGVKVLYNSMRRIGLPASSRMTMQHIHRLVPLVNAAFPGYAESGLLGLLVGKGMPHG